MGKRLTLAASKAAASLSRGLGRGGGGALPGVVAEKFDKQLAGKLAASLPNGVILVTGTNGKTTTTKLIREILEAQGERVVTNASGSNLKRGIVAALIDAADRRGSLSATIGLFEVDEASLRLVAGQLQPRHIVVTNLFRDQLDRYGELDTTARLIGEGIAATTADLHLNADDPLVASLAKYVRRPARVHYFGIEGVPVNAVATHQTAIDSDRCPVCHNRLVFTRVFYGHIGHYKCPTGDFARPTPEVVITNVERADREGSRFVLAIDGKRTVFEFPLAGTYNLYNALAAVGVGAALGIAPTLLVSTLVQTKAAFGRVEQIEINGRTICLLLIKNPAGFAQVLQTFVVGRDAVRVMFVINDLAADGRDVSWLWDVPLEGLTAHKVMAIASGIRGSDMAVRLKYAGVEARSVHDVGAGIEELLATTPKGETAYILPTYTAMLEVRKLLASRTKLEAIPR